jgi:hypothetical protein
MPCHWQWPTEMNVKGRTMTASSPLLTAPNGPAIIRLAAPNMIAMVVTMATLMAEAWCRCSFRRWRDPACAPGGMDGGLLQRCPVRPRRRADRLVPGPLGESVHRLGSGSGRLPHLPADRRPLLRVLWHGALYFASQGAGRMLWPVLAIMARVSVIVVGCFVLARSQDARPEQFFRLIAAGMAIHAIVIGAAIRLGAWTRGAARVVSGPARTTPRG